MYLIGHYRGLANKTFVTKKADLGSISAWVKMKAIKIVFAALLLDVIIKTNYASKHSSASVCPSYAINFSWVWHRVVNPAGLFGAGSGQTLIKILGLIRA